MQDHADYKVEINGCRVLQQDGSTINIINVYNANSNNNEIDGIINELSKKILANEGLIITGDFNAHSKVWCKYDIVNSSGRSMEDVLLQSPICLAAPNGLPTHKNHFTGGHTTIDLTLASPNLATTTTVTTPDHSLLLSDYSPINIYIEGHGKSCNPAQLDSTSTPHIRLKYQIGLNIENSLKTYQFRC